MSSDRTSSVSSSSPEKIPCRTFENASRVRHDCRNTFPIEDDRCEWVSRCDFLGLRRYGIFGAGTPRPKYRHRSRCSRQLVQFTVDVFLFKPQDSIQLSNDLDLRRIDHTICSDDGKRETSELMPDLLPNVLQALSDRTEVRWNRHHPFEVGVQTAPFRKHRGSRRSRTVPSDGASPTRTRFHPHEQ